ncbi:hypothetical protein SDC9_188461 [bioreactor metagenome]|uniref:Uncharacterized protein n=1 Tax=bioreactor metagenome TaxID=1076179 RepID=A0A645HPD4_9ZZZZ
MSEYWRSIVGMFRILLLVVVNSRSKSRIPISEALRSLDSDALIFSCMLSTCILMFLYAGLFSEVELSMRSLLIRVSLYLLITSTKPGSLIPRFGISLFLFAGFAIKVSIYLIRLSWVSISVLLFSYPSLRVR